MLKVLPMTILRKSWWLYEHLPCNLSALLKNRGRNILSLLNIIWKKLYVRWSINRNRDVLRAECFQPCPLLLPCLLDKAGRLWTLWTSTRKLYWFILFILSTELKVENILTGFQPVSCPCSDQTESDLASSKLPLCLQTIAKQHSFSVRMAVSSYLSCF